MRKAWQEKYTMALRFISCSEPPDDAEALMASSAILLDEDQDDALRLVKSFVARLEQQSHQGLKSHLDKRGKLK